MAQVVLPRSLVALFPGAERRVDVEGATVSEVIDRLDEQIPGIRNRLIDAGPTLRTHLNVYVDGGPATLATPVEAGAVIHVVPAVSGGAPRRRPPAMPDGAGHITPGG